jgi:hypothetical protein
MFVPKNEIGVRELFAQRCQTLGYRILDSQRGFPDYMLLDPQGQEIRAEAEFASENFIWHSHDVTACDLIICWRHTRAMKVPVLELASGQVYPPGCLPPPSSAPIQPRKANREPSPAPPWVELREGSDTPRIGRDEMNLCEFPFATLTCRTKGSKTLVFSDTIHNREGKIIERTWTVTGSDLFGLPTPMEEHLYIALMEATKRGDFASRRVPITRYEIINRLKWPDNGKSYQRLREGLQRLQGVSIYADQAFWDNKAKSYITMGFGILDGFLLSHDEPRGRKAEGAPLPQSWILWNEFIFQSMQCGNIKHLDTDFYFSLDHYISQRLYRHLDKKRYDGKRRYATNLFDLAFCHLGLDQPEKPYPSLLKQRLQPAHEELLDQKFLKEVRYYEGREGEVVEYRFGPPQKKTLARPAGPAFSPRPPDPTWSDEERKLIEELIALGVTLTVAQKLVREQPREEIRRQLDYLPHRPAADPAALLVKAITEAWSPPKHCDNPPTAKNWRFCTSCGQTFQDGDDHDPNCPGPPRP